MEGDSMFGNQISISDPQKMDSKGIQGRTNLEMGGTASPHINYRNKDNETKSSSEVNSNTEWFWDSHPPKESDFVPMKESTIFSPKGDPPSIEEISEQSLAFEKFMDSNNVSKIPYSEWSETFNIPVPPSKDLKESRHGMMDLTNITQRPSSSRSIDIPSSSGWNRIQSRSSSCSSRSMSLTRNVGSLRKSRTPSPYMFNSQSSMPVRLMANGVLFPVNRRTTYPPEIEPDRYFAPIAPSVASSPVELRVTNLDQSISQKELIRALFLLFGEHVLVLHIECYMQSDGMLAAKVKVPSVHEAQFVISQLHRRKLGHRKIMISFSESSHNQNLQFLRWQVTSLLLEVPHYKLPLFKFVELFESRYLTTVSVADLYKLSDVCHITDEDGRMVSLNPELRNATSPLPLSQDVEPYCSKHHKFKHSADKGWAEQDVPLLPNVCVSLKIFSENVLKLLASHNNSLPLSSFCDCYKAECGELTINEAGVPLEHLVTCVNNVELVTDSGIKYLRPTSKQSYEKKFNEEPNFASLLYRFGRELVDLLKALPHSQLPFTKFVPTYHHYFGRQCRVADYGYLKLIDLLEALPNVIQVFGEGNRRMVTLTHEAQVRRFVSDLLRVLKVQPCKKMFLSEIPAAFERVLGRPFDPVDYGLCELGDLLDHVSKTMVMLSETEEGTVIYIPKKEQNPEQIQRTKSFIKEAIELLSLAPQCTMTFNKFIPAYHHHFGYQCRLSLFGFTKLIELFEAIPDIVKVEEDGQGERKVSLTNEVKVKMLDAQIGKLVIPNYPPGLMLEELPGSFSLEFGYALKAELYEFSDLENLVESLSMIKVVDTEKGKLLIPVEEAFIKHVMMKVIKALIESPDGRLTHSELKSHFDNFHESYISINSLTENMPQIVKIEREANDNIVELTPIYQFAKKLTNLLNQRDGRSQLAYLDKYFFNEYQTTIQPSQYGYSSTLALLEAIPQVVSLKRTGIKTYVILNKEFLSTKVTSMEDKVITRPSSAKYFTNAAENGPTIILPELTVPSGNIPMSAFFSPCKGLLPPSARPDRETACMNYLTSPDPSELPIPYHFTSQGNNVPNFIQDKQFMLQIQHDNSEIQNSSGEFTNSSNSDCETPSSLSKRKIRLAAQFSTPPL